MKKVLCINGWRVGQPQASGFGETQDEIYEGDAYTVIDETNKKGHEVFVLAERRRNCFYLRSRFVLSSQIDEATFNRNYKKQLV